VNQPDKAKPIRQPYVSGILNGLTQTKPIQLGTGIRQRVREGFRNDAKPNQYGRLCAGHNLQRKLTPNQYARKGKIICIAIYYICTCIAENQT
jgi:hypothetical protein